MATLAAQTIAVTGTEVTYGAATSADKAVPRAYQFLHVKNGSASDVDVTLTVPGKTWGQDNPDVAVTVTAGEERFIYLPPQIADPSTGLISWSYEATTSVTVALLAL